MTEYLALDAPITDAAIRTVNFFNGRLLTGPDLAREQQARREADQRLGQAVGDGIAHGLMVSLARTPAPDGRPAVAITAGLAVNRRGQPLMLARTVQVALGTPSPPAARVASRECLFSDCAPVPSGDVVRGGGIWLLSIAPAFADEGRAPVSGLIDAPARCAIDAVAEAVRFRIIEVRSGLHGLALDDPRLRNRLAYRCFGNAVARAWASGLPGGQPAGDDLIDALRRDGLDDADVPLALIAFDAAGGALFCCPHSVRRPIDGSAQGPALFDAVRPRRDAVGQAMLAQFIDQLATSDALARPLRERFAHLPAAALVGGLGALPDERIRAWFAGMTVRGPLYIDPARIEPLLRASLTAPAIDTASDHAIILYRVARPPREVGEPALIFASGHLPIASEARFNLAHWDFANFALIP
jgi:hypothetical protein